MPALRREAAWAEERLLGDLRQSVPQNGRVHLLGLELRGRVGCTPRGSCNRTLLLEGFLEGSLTVSAS